MKLPKLIKPCPIVEGIVEIRFDSLMPYDAIFGVIYKDFNKKYPNLKKLPILQIPEAMRTQDKNLIYKPYYRLSNKDFILQVGPQVLSLSSPVEYVGWPKFYSEIKSCLKKVNNMKIVDKIKRIGIRYINFFELDVFEKVNLDIKMNKKPLDSKETIFRTALQSGKFTSFLQISNNSELMDRKGIMGSIIDIDTFVSVEKNNLDKNVVKLIDSGHSVEKKLFFNLLKEEYLNQLNPEY